MKAYSDRWAMATPLAPVSPTATRCSRQSVMSAPKRCSSFRASQPMPFSEMIAIFGEDIADREAYRGNELNVAENFSVVDKLRGRQLPYYR